MRNFGADRARNARHATRKMLKLCKRRTTHSVACGEDFGGRGRVWRANFAAKFIEIFAVSRGHHGS